MAKFGLYSVKNGNELDPCNTIKYDSKQVFQTSKGLGYRFGVSDHNGKVQLDTNAIANGVSRLGGIDTKDTPCISGVSVTDT